MNIEAKILHLTPVEEWDPTAGKGAHGLGTTTSHSPILSYRHHKHSMGDREGRRIA